MSSPAHLSPADGTRALHNNRGSFDRPHGGRIATNREYFGISTQCFEKAANHLATQPSRLQNDHVIFSITTTTLSMGPPIYPASAAAVAASAAEVSIIDSPSDTTAPRSSSPVDHLR